MTVNKTPLSYDSNNTILYLVVLKVAIKAALQTDGQTCYWGLLLLKVKQIP